MKREFCKITWNLLYTAGKPDPCTTVVRGEAVENHNMSALDDTDDGAATFKVAT